MLRRIMVRKYILAQKGELRSKKVFIRAEPLKATCTSPSLASISPSE